MFTDSFFYWSTIYILTQALHYYHCLPCAGTENTSVPYTAKDCGFSEGRKRLNAICSTQPEIYCL